jgi:hypothetical protein
VAEEVKQIMVSKVAEDVKQIMELEKRLMEGVKTTLQNMKYHLLDDETFIETITFEAQLITKAECYAYMYEKYEMMAREWYGDIKIEHLKARHLIACNLIHDEIGVRFTTELLSIETPFDEAIVIDKIIDIKPFRFTEESTEE